MANSPIPDIVIVEKMSVPNRLSPLSFSVKAGEVVHLIGPNGSGKSSLMAAIAGLLPFSGVVHIGEQNVANLSLPSLAKKRAFLMQQQIPAFDMTVAHFLSLSVPISTKFEQNQAKLQQVDDAVNHLTDALNISDKITTSIHKLSGGEWQRVRLVASFLQVWPSLNPESQLLLLDEPCASLDVGQEPPLFKLINALAATGITILLANHDMNRALQLNHKVALLKEGSLQAYGASEEILTPDTLADVFNTKVQKAMFGGKGVLLFE